MFTEHLEALISETEVGNEFFPLSFAFSFRSEIIFPRS